jgi:hypothetical protein
MSLITTKEIAEQFIRINFINSISSLPDMEAAEERYLLPVIGYDLYDKVINLATAATIENETDAELLKKCRAMVVPLAYLLELPTIQTQLTDAGLRTISTENMQAAHRWEYNQVRDYLVDKGSFAIESLLRFLFQHKDSYSEWTESNEYKEASSLVFKTGDEFNRYFRLHQPHRMFWELRPLIKEVEDFYIHSAIGEAFYTTLKTKSEPTAEEKHALELIKKAVAQTTVLKAVEKLSVKITEKGFTVLMSAGDPDSENSGDAPAENNRLSLLYDSCQRSSDAYLLQLSEYLNAKASTTVFKEYFESSYYEKPATICTESPNAKRKIFGF